MSELTQRAREWRASVDEVAPGSWDISDGVVWRIDWVPDPSDPTGQSPMPVQQKVCDTAPGQLAEAIAAAPQLVADLTVALEKAESDLDDAVRDYRARDQDNDLLHAALERVEKLADELADTPMWNGRPSQINLATAGMIRGALEDK